MNDFRSKEENAILSRIANLEDQLGRQRELLAEERLKRAGVAIGDIVIHRGEEYRVFEIEPPPFRKAWVKGNPRKKDGSFGKAERNLFSDWELSGGEAS